jgi:hypothetical protein
MGDDESDENEGSTVVFRLSNRPEPARCLTASYVAFDPFAPDRDSLHEIRVFRRCVSRQDFLKILDLINAELPYFRSRSLAASCVAMLLSFVAIVVVVMLSVPGGITLQVLTTLAHTVVQAVLRSLCIKKINATLDELVNKALTAARLLFVVADMCGEGCTNFVSVDFCAKRAAPGRPASPVLRQSSFRLPEGGGGHAAKRDDANEDSRNNPLSVPSLSTQNSLSVRSA